MLWEKTLMPSPMNQDGLSEYEGGDFSRKRQELPPFFSKHFPGNNLLHNAGKFPVLPLKRQTIPR